MASEIILLSFSVFVVVFLGVGAFAAKRSAPTEVDYLLGNRSFGAWFVGLSAGATGNSGFIMLGAVGMGYTMGLSGVIMALAWFLGDLVFWSFFPKSLIVWLVIVTAARYQSFSVPEFRVGAVLR